MPRPTAPFLLGLFLLASQITAETRVPSPTLTRPQDATYDLAGPLKTQIDGVITNWLLRAPDANPAMLDMFRDREKSPPRDLLPWSGEFAGKYLTAATQVLRLTGDPKHRARLDQFVKDLAACQANDGYLGPFPEASRLTGKAPNVDKGKGGTWDAWGHYHAMVGLILWYDETRDVRARDAAKRIGDLLCDHFLSQGKTVAATGSAEMNQAVAHSMAMLYARTGEKRYLQLAEKVVAEFADPAAGDYLRGALAGKEFFQLRKPRWESLHPIMALPELYYATGNADYRKAFEHLWWSIAKLDRHNNGGFSSGEQAHGDPYHRGAIETCCTIAWVAMSVEMLRLTGDPRVADELELSTLNQVVGLHSPDGSWCTYNTPMDGQRIPSTKDISFQIRPGSEQLNCCSVNAARGFGMIIDWALMSDPEGGLALNWYGASTLTAKVNEVRVRLRQETTYPHDGRVTLHVSPETPATFALKLRIPHWSAKTRVTVNDAEVKDVSPGAYLPLSREWRTGDRVTLNIDFAPRYWAGERDYANKASVYRGPILLAYESPQAAPKFDAAWKSFGPHHATRDRGAAVEYTFTGDTITWQGFHYDDAGKAKVSIDGKEIATVDQYGPKRDVPFNWQHTSLSPAGPHTIRIETLGQKSDASKDVWINVAPFAPATELPTLTPGRIAQAKVIPGDGPELLIDIPADGAPPAIRLRDFGTAGRDRHKYTSWLPIPGVPKAGFTRENPSRTRPSS